MISPENEKYIKSLKGKVPDSQIRNEIRRVYGVKKTAGNALFNKIFKSKKSSVSVEQSELEDTPLKKKQATATYSHSSGVIESVDASIQTLDQLISSCAIDLEKWRVEKYLVRSASGRSQNDPTLFQVKAWLERKTSQAECDAIIKSFIDRANKHSPAFKVPNIKASNRNEKLLEISVPDLHLAKLCWGVETGGQDYDIDIASAEYKKAVYGLYKQAGQVDRVLLPVGNDIFNSDNISGTTTAGTPQATSEDSRWPKMFMTGCEILVETITTLAYEVPVDVIIVAGNHDKERCFYLGEYLKAWFRNHPRVTINNSPRQRKYYRFGNTLLGFTHGSEEKPDKLPLLMANEEKKVWAETKFRQWHLGHLHHEITRDIQGVVVRFLTSLCPPDEWHSSKGYVGSVQAAEAFMYDKENGLCAVYYHNA